MIRAGFLDPESRKDLTELARDGSAAHRLARRANALVLLDDGMSCGDVAKDEKDWPPIYYGRQSLQIILLNVSGLNSVI